jgi:hypothetical protein
MPLLFGKPFQNTNAIFFAWLMLHNRVLTADNMLRQNWPCDQLCSFCLCSMETTQDILCECNFVEAVWNLVAAKFNLLSYVVMRQTGGPINWFQKIMGSGSLGYLQQTVEKSQNA